MKGTNTHKYSTRTVMYSNVIGQGMWHRINQPIDWSIRLALNQSIDKSIIQIVVGLAVGQSVSQLIIHPSDTQPVSQWVYQFVGRSERNPDTNTDKKKTKNGKPANFDFNPWHPRSVCIFSTLFSIHFLGCWQGEFVQQSRASLVDDHFLYSHDL